MKNVAYGILAFVSGLLFIFTFMVNVGSKLFVFGVIDKSGMFMSAIDLLASISRDIGVHPIKVYIALWLLTLVSCATLVKVTLRKKEV